MSKTSAIGKRLMKTVFGIERIFDSPSENRREETPALSRPSSMPKQRLMSACERIRQVLEPHLGQEVAIERAANITQALQYADDPSVDTILEMLSKTALRGNEPVASQVLDTWEEVVDCHLAPDRAAVTCTYTDFPPPRNYCLSALI
jgi:hypothetical protein